MSAMTPSYAFIIATVVALVTHYLTSSRFKNELKVKKKEKNINDAKDMINLYEKELLERIHLTRSYLINLKLKKDKSIEIDDEFRKIYKKTIRDWNITIDYKYNVIYRSGMLNKTKEFDKIQEQLRGFHDFIRAYVDNIDQLNVDVVDEKLQELKEFQTSSYSFITKIHKKADEEWNNIFNQDSALKRWFIVSLDYAFKTISIYLFFCILSFIYSFLFT